MKKTVGVLEQNEELYRSALWTMRGCYWQIVSLCIKVPFDFVLLSPHREATLSPWNDCARYIYTCSPRISWARVLFREVKDTSRGSVLKMHWIRTIESFYLGRLLKKKRSKRIRPKKRMSFSFLARETIRTQRSKLQYRSVRTLRGEIENRNARTILRAQHARHVPPKSAITDCTRNALIAAAASLIISCS